MNSRMDNLRSAISRQMENLRIVTENLQFSLDSLPFEDGVNRISADESDRRELEAYRALFDSFNPRPVDFRS